MLPGLIALLVMPAARSPLRMPMFGLATIVFFSPVDTLIPVLPALYSARFCRSVVPSVPVTRRFFCASAALAITAPVKRVLPLTSMS